MLSSVAALTNGYTSPMAMPQSRVAASMDASADLKALAKSLNPVVVSRRARIARSHCQPPWPPNPYPNPNPLRRATTTR